MTPCSVLNLFLLHLNSHVFVCSYYPSHWLSEHVTTLKHREWLLYSASVYASICPSCQNSKGDKLTFLGFIIVYDEPLRFSMIHWKPHWVITCLCNTARWSEINNDAQHLRLLQTQLLPCEFVSLIGLPDINHIRTLQLTHSKLFGSLIRTGLETEAGGFVSSKICRLLFKHIPDLFWWAPCLENKGLGPRGWKITNVHNKQLIFFWGGVGEVRLLKMYLLRRALQRTLRNGVCGGG